MDLPLLGNRLSSSSCGGLLSSGVLLFVASSVVVVVVVAVVVSSVVDMNNAPSLYIPDNAEARSMSVAVLYFNALRRRLL